jgi:anti-sigma B factor antagonist
MTMQRRAVAVKQIPEKLSGKQGQVFLRELEAILLVERPYIVLDCSRVAYMNRSVVDLMLCCLEEAIKRNGDIKLAAVPAGAETILEHTGLNRLFDIFDTTDAAVSGFHLPHRAANAPAVVHGMIAARSADDKKSKKSGWSFWHAQSVGRFEEN